MGLWCSASSCGKQPSSIIKYFRNVKFQFTAAYINTTDSLMAGGADVHGAAAFPLSITSVHSLKQHCNFNISGLVTSV